MPHLENFKHKIFEFAAFFRFIKTASAFTKMPFFIFIKKLFLAKPFSTLMSNVGFTCKGIFRYMPVYRSSSYCRANITIAATT